MYVPVHTATSPNKEVGLIFSTPNNGTQPPYTLSTLGVTLDLPSEDECIFFTDHNHLREWRAEALRHKSTLRVCATYAARVLTKHYPCHKTRLASVTPTTREIAKA